MYTRIKDVKFKSKNPIKGLKKPLIELAVWRANLRHNYVYRVEILPSPVTKNKRLTLATFSEVPTAKEFLYAIEKPAKELALKVFESSTTAREFKAEVLKLRSTLMLTNFFKTKLDKLVVEEEQKLLEEEKNDDEE